MTNVIFNPVFLISCVILLVVFVTVVFCNHDIMVVIVIIGSCYDVVLHVVIVIRG